MQVAQDGGWVPHASGMTTQVGVSVGGPASVNTPGYWPKLTHISPARHFLSPQSAPHVPAAAAHCQVPDAPDPTHVQLRRAEVLSQYSQVVWYWGLHPAPMVPQPFDPQGPRLPHLQRPMPVVLSTKQSQASLEVPPLPQALQ
jgi:hypothetical protein